jgi:large subunit ribosomal protein L8e
MEDLLNTLSKKTRLRSYLEFRYPHFIIQASFFILRQLPRNQFISLIELYPNKSVEYVRSPGSKAKMLKMDTRTNTSIIKLPSGVKKVFSIYSIASLGQVLLVDKKSQTNNKAGYYNLKGRKPIVRGVAMNPVEHPHGGGNHQHVGHPTTSARNAPAGKKVGLIAARRTGILKGGKGKVK